MEVGTAEVALVFSGIVCLIGVLNYIASMQDHKKDAADDRIKALNYEHEKDLETREWRVEARGLMHQHSESLDDIRREQRETRQEVRVNADHIRDLSDRHRTDIAKVNRRVDDLMGVMQGEAELEENEK